MAFDYSTLIRDRTAADVERVRAVAAKLMAGTATEAELAEFNSAAMKGAYDYTDLNRVSAAMEALRAELAGYGYSVPGYSRIRVAHKDSALNAYTWYEADTPTAAEMQQYLANVSAIRSALEVFRTTPAVPADMEALLYTEANNIEQILEDVELLLTRAAQAWFYSGEVFSGEV